MSVSNGQQANETTFNEAFVSKTTDSTTVGKIDLNNADAASGTQITNAQRQHNSIASFVGAVVNGVQNLLPTWVSNAVGLSTDTLKDRAEALTVQVGTNTADISLRQLLSEKSQANGYASLDGSGQVPLSELPSSVTGARQYLGTWDAATNTPTLANGDSVNAGSEYAVISDGTVDFGAGNITFTNGDTVIYDGAIWSKIDGSIVRDLNDVRDVNSPSPSERDLLRRNASSEWVDFDPDQIADDAATGANQTLTAPGDNSIVRLTSATLTSVEGIPAPTYAQRFVLINATGVDVDVLDETGGTPANHIITGTGATLSLSADASLWLAYDTTTGKWRVVGGSGGGSANFPLLAPTDGTVGAPRYSFLNDSGMGMYKNGTDLSFAVGGSQSFEANATQLLPNSAGGMDLGSATRRWNKLNVNQVGLIVGTDERATIGRFSTPSGGTASGVFGNGTDDEVGLFTDDDATADATATNDVLLESGNKTAGTGNSGDIVARPGTSAGGTRGSLQIDDGRVANGTYLRSIDENGRVQFGRSPILSIIDGPDSDMDINSLTWAAYADAVSNVPEDGTGGSPNVTAAFTSTPSEVVAGSGSLKISKDGANRQGEGVSVDKSVDPAYRGQSCRISFSFEASANFDRGTIGADSDLTVWAYDVTNSILLNSNFNRISEQNRYEADIFVPSGCQTIRFIYHVATTNASAWDFFVSDYRCELVPFSTFDNSSDWVDGGTVTVASTGSAPTKGGINTDQVWYRFDGQDMVVRYELDFSSTGTIGTGDYLWEIPGGFEIDLDLVTENATVLGGTPNQIVNTVGSFTATRGVSGGVVVYDATQVRLVGSNDAARGAVGQSFIGFDETDASYSAEFRVPIKGRTSGSRTPASINLNAKAIFVGTQTSEAVSANQDVAFTAQKDTTGSWTGTAYEVKSPGDYKVTWFATSTAACEMQIELGGTSLNAGQTIAAASQSGTCSTIVEDLNYGDLISVSIDAAATLSNGRLSIHKIGSENLPYTPRVCYLKDVKPNNTAGGTFNSGSFSIRTLNDISGDQSFISLSASVFTLDPGTYRIRATAPAFFVGRHKARLRDVTNGADVIIGRSAVSQSSGASSENESLIEGEFSTNLTTSYRIEHQCAVTRTTNGYGVESNFGVDEVYTQVVLTKIL